MRMEYLTDEELEQLMEHVENNELIAAPPDLMEQIFIQLEENTKKIKPVYHRDKKKEYRRYCFQVIVSMAAAITLVFLMPYLQEKQDIQPPKEGGIFRTAVYANKQEALEDTSLFMEAFGGLNFFNQVDKFKIFNQ